MRSEFLVCCIIVIVGKLQLPAMNTNQQDKGCTQNDGETMGNLYKVVGESSKMLLREVHASNEKNPGWLFYIRDYTTQLYRDYNKPL